MDEFFIAIGIIGYVISGYIAYRILFADTGKAFGRVTRADRNFLALYGLMGPLGLIIACLIWFISSHNWNGDEVIWRKDDK